jgi:glutathione S-transferase
MGAYDLYQAFGAFPADDQVAKEKFEKRRAPQYFGALNEIYQARPFAAGETPTFADCMAYEALGWCARRNEVCKDLLESMQGLRSFCTRFEALPAIADFLKRQALARQKDDSV